MIARARGRCRPCSWSCSRPPDPSRAYYGTDTRAQALLIGAVLAFVWTRRGAPTSRSAWTAVQVVGVLGVADLAWMVTHRNDVSSDLYHGGFALVAVAAAAVIAAAMTAGPVRSVLGLRPLALIGLISYGLYLWHWPIYVFLTPGRVGAQGRALFVRIAVTFVVATISFVALESPVRERRWQWTRAPLRWAPISAVAVAVVVLASAVLPSLGPSAGGATASGQTQTPLEILKRALARNDVPPQPGAAKVLLAGDSVAFTLSYTGIRSRSVRSWDAWRRERSGAGSCPAWSSVEAFRTRAGPTATIWRPRTASRWRRWTRTSRPCSSARGRSTTGAWAGS